MRRRNRIDKLLGAEHQLAGVGVAGGMAVEARLGLGGQLDGLLRADQRLLDRLLDGRGCGHGGRLGAESMRAQCDAVCWLLLLLLLLLRCVAE